MVALQVTLVLYAEWEFEKQMPNSDSGTSSPFCVKHIVGCSCGQIIKL